MAERSYDSRAKGPLDGVFVLDLSRLVAGNILTHQLADFGAEVVKVEPAAGDTLRQWKVKGVPTAWKVYGRNKKSVALDLRAPRAVELVLELAGKASCFVESFRPGTLEAMGLSPQRLLERNPRLVIVRISGWGQTGPYNRRPGFGTVVEGLSGFASMNGFGDREPLLPPFYMADSIAGLYGASAAMIALRHVEVNGGAGQVIDLSLLDPMIAILGPQAANFRITGKVKPRTGNRSTNTAPRNAYRTSDGRYLCLSASTQQMTERLLRAIGRPELIDDPRFRANEDRLAHWRELDDILGGFIGARTLDENMAHFERTEVTIGPMLDISQIVEDPHVRARDILVDLPDDQVGAIPMHHPVPRLDSTPAVFVRPAPRIGEHNAEILARIGIGAAELTKLVEQGVVARGAGESAGKPS